MNCPLCKSSDSSLWSQDKMRPYFLCRSCTLIFVPRNHLISFEEERKRYDTHENSEEDLRYRQYLAKISNAVIPRLHPGAKGLDFGCGASTLLAQIFAEEGFPVDSYDIHYHPQEEIWEKDYDFIVLSEVIEHLTQPYEIMRELKARLRPGGQFFIKTRFYPSQKNEFGSWYYKNDPTHIQFFNLPSLEKLAQLLNMQGAEKLDSPDLSRLWC